MSLAKDYLTELRVCKSWFPGEYQFSCAVMSDSLWPHGLQHARPPVHHQLLELAQSHAHQVSDAIQLLHPL